MTIVHQRGDGGEDEAGCDGAVSDSNNYELDPIQENVVQAWFKTF